MRPKLLVIDDDEVGCRLIEAIFLPEGYEVVARHDGRSGLTAAETEGPDVVLLDLKLPDTSGIEVLDRLKVTHPGLPVIVLTAHAEVRTAVRATQLGAFDYRTKPIDPDEIAFVVRRAVETRALELEVKALRQQIGGSLVQTQMGPSREISEVIEQVRTVAESTFTVLVTGETGTGKELIAQAVHQESDRRAKPFIALDCGAIPENLLESELFGHEKGAFTGAQTKKEGRFQLAEGGTLFLDEVGNLPLGLQSKLLRVLESREVQTVGGTKSKPMDVRFVAATNNDLPACVNDGRFRADLYFRLAQYTIALPALRQRKSDISYLAHRFLEEASVELRRPVHELTTDALVTLRAYDWPGNVRELRNVIRRAVLQTKDYAVGRDVIQALIGKPADAASHASAAASDRSLKEIASHAAREAERGAICEALRVARGNKTHAARALKTDYKTLHLKMRQLGISGREYEP